MVFSNKYYRISYNFPTIAKVFLLGAAVLAAGLWLNQTALPLILVLFAKSVLLGGFLLVVWKLRFIPEGEREKIRGLMIKLTQKVKF